MGESNQYHIAGWTDRQAGRQAYLLQTEALVVWSKHSTLQVDQRGGVWTQPGTGDRQVVPGQTLWVRLRTCRDERGGARETV